MSFADDTSIFISGKTAQTLFDKRNDELCNIGNWLVANKLSLNANKTKCVYFKTANSKTPPSDLNLVIRNIPIERVSSVRVLGTIIHENLSWKEHMLTLRSTLRATLGAVIRAKPYLSKHFLLSIYHSLVVSRIRSCMINWNHGNSTILNQLLGICNKFIRLISGLSRNEDVLPLMKQHNLQAINDIFKYEMAVLMFRFHNRTLPSAFDLIFQSKSTSPNFKPTVAFGHLYLAIRRRFGEMAGSIACQIVLGSSCYAFGSSSNRILVFFFSLFISSCHLERPPVSKNSFAPRFANNLILSIFTTQSPYILLHGMHSHSAWLKS